MVVENREPYYFIIICKYVKKSHYPYFLISCCLQLLTTNERSNYYKLYGRVTKFFFCHQGLKGKIIRSFRL